MFIKKIFENKIDESVHKQFVRFGKGTYEKRAVMNIAKRPSSLRISTTFEYAIDLIIFVTSLATTVRVSGIILNKVQIPGLEAKKKAGLFVHDINKEMPAEALRKLVGSSYFALLDCSGQGIELKMKKKLPKPGKSGELKVDDKFCQLEIAQRFWAPFWKDFCFDMPAEFKKARVEHTYHIKEIVIPKELEKEKDFEKIRLGAKRKGVLVRKIIVDGNESIKEKEMVV
ncbi:MAG: hypothetical protein K6T16_02475 [Candidatus Pacearchaeota archaeon]|nr:hypothetical protein [Candidatus Pacearchaeota archaeon]